MRLDLQAYAEFFCSPQQWERLRARLNSGRYTTVTYIASSLRGDSLSSPPNQRNVLTWGIFPGKEIIQTTFVGVESFDIWKKEVRKDFVLGICPRGRC